jgi:ABC-2 type transport system permease protein
MNTQSNSFSESLNKQRVTAAAMTSTRPFYWSVRRELWENRFVYLAPIGVACAFLFGFIISAFRLPAKVRGLSALDPLHYREAIAMPYDIAAGLMMLVTILVSVFYCVDALHSERRDRSILFWKSLPVSDTTAVLAKASIPLVVVPLLTFAIAIAMQFLMLLVSSVVLLANGLSVSNLWSQLSFVQMSLLLLYHLLTAHTLWPAPVYCWLLLVSGWARRAVFLWAALPLIAIAGIEGIAFRTAHFAAMVATRLIGGASNTTMSQPNVFPTNPMAHITPVEFLASPSLLIGLLLAAAFLAGAVWLRRNRGPI